MADLATWANVAEILGAATVVGAAGFALVQLREARRHREQGGAIEFIHSIQTPEFRRAFLQVWGLPEGMTAEEVRARGATLEEAATAVAFTCETVGVMVERRILDLGTVDRLIGGLVRDSWRKLAPYVEAERGRLGSRNFGEWFQWLAERLAEHGDPRKADGAYVTHRAWRP